MKRLVFTVTNDLTYDQRMQRICGTLVTSGYNVTLVGRARASSAPMVNQGWKQVRLSCFFDTGKRFYIEYNIRLFYWLLKNRFDAVCAIDLDTALPVIAVSRLKRKPWIYDAHEFFSEMEEIVTRPFVHAIWKRIEIFVFKRTKYAYTISDGYAQLFLREYRAKISVVKNLPKLRNTPEHAANEGSVIYQGAINEGRGLEASMAAAKSLDWINLDIYGSGPLFDSLQRKRGNGVAFRGAVAPSELVEITPKYWCGLTLFSSTGLHHWHSLANRFFDYVHAEIPQVAMNYPEYAQFNNKIEVAILIDELSIEALTDAFNALKNDTKLYQRLKKNCSAAKQKFNWQNESGKLIDFYNNIFAQP